MEQIRPTSENVHLSSRSYAKLAGKALLVAAVVAGLAAATFFSGGAAIGLVAAGAASWKVGLVIVGVIASGVSLGGSVHFALQHNMFEDTGENLADSAKFLRDTLLAGLYVGAKGVECVREWEIWNLITAR